MAEFFPPVIFEIKAKATEAIAEFSRVNKELALMEKNGTIASASLARVERAGKLAGTALLGFAGIAGIVSVVSVKAAMDQEKALANLKTAIENTGVSFATAMPFVDRYANAMVKLGFEDNETIAATAKLTAALGSPKTALESLTVAADLARFKNMSLVEASTLLARASTGQARGLRDLGIVLKANLPAGTSYADILKLIEQRTQGAAKAFGETLPGKLAIANAQFDQLKEKIGYELIPYAIQLTDWISNTAIPKLDEFGNWFKDNLGPIKVFAGLLASIWATSKIIAFVGMLTTIISTLRTLTATAAAAGVALAYATGGASLVAASAALVGGAAIYGGVKLKDLLSDKPRYGKNKTPYDPMSGRIDDYTSLSAIKGRGNPLPASTTAPTTNFNQVFHINSTNPYGAAKEVARITKYSAPISK